VSTHRDPDDREAQTLQGLDLPPDEGVTDLGVLGYQIGDADRTNLGAEYRRADGATVKRAALPRLERV